MSELVGYRAILVQRARAAADDLRRYDDTEEVVSVLVEMSNELIKATESTGSEVGS